MEYLAVGIYIECFAGTCLKKHHPTPQFMFMNV